MLWIRTWQLAVKSLLLHPLRSLLTVLGIFIGVASVIWLVAIGEGISQEAQRQFQSLGASNIIVRSIKPPSEATAHIRGPVPYGITRSEYKNLVDTIPTISSAVQIREMRRQFSYEGRLVDGRLVGCTPEYAEVTKLNINLGRFITDTDIREKQNFCVLAWEVAERLFPYENPIGRAIHLPEHSDYYYVIGVMDSRTPSAAIGGSLEAQVFSGDVYVPISTVQQRIGDMVVTRRSGSFEGEIVELNQVTLRVNDIKTVLSTAELVKDALRNHDKMQDVSTIVPLELIEQAKTTGFMFMVFMALIAAISLLVGGIGIMNIMLATVTERTREIGIRRALGARQSDIIFQFLIEAVVLSIVGGLTGVAMGLLCPLTMVSLRDFMFEYYPLFTAKWPQVMREMQPVIVWESIPWAFGISVCVGVLFGLYPAARAAQMDPIEALRHE